MKNTTILLLSLIFSAINLNVAAVETASEALNSRVSIELNANIKADCLFAERMIMLDIADELDNSKNFSDMYQGVNNYSLNTRLAQKSTSFSNSLIFDNSAD